MQFEDDSKVNVGRGKPLTHRLTAAEVQYLYHMYDQGKAMQYIADFFGISVLSVQRILKKEDWTDKQKKLWEVEKLPKIERRPGGWVAPKQQHEPPAKPATKVVTAPKPKYRRPEYTPPPAPLSDFIEQEDLDKAMDTIKKAQDIRNVYENIPSEDVLLPPRRQEEEIDRRILRQKMDNVFAALELLIDELQGFKRAVTKLR